MRRGVAVVAFVVALAVAAPGTAAAKNVGTNCAGIQSALDNASNGDVITITETPCELTQPLVLPEDRLAPFAITLQGKEGGVTLDGAGIAGDRILRGTVHDGDVLDVTIRSLTFRDGTAAAGTSGGAIELTGNVGATLDGDRFFGNRATSQNAGGGAVDVHSTSAKTTVVRNSVFGGTGDGQANAAFLGGGLSVDDLGSSVVVAHDRFAGNEADALYGGGFALRSDGTVTIRRSTVTGNSAASAGGGGYANGAAVIVEGNRFGGNTVSLAPDQVGQGGGLLAGGSGNAASLVQRGNRFDRNRIVSPDQPPGAVDGGGEWASGFASLRSRNDRFTRNFVAGSADDEGAGLGVHACFGSASGFSHQRMVNLVAAGNSAGSAVEGAGVYVGCGDEPAHLTLLDSTIAGNHATSPGGAAGLFGDANDTLVLRNSIVAANSGAPNLSGFGSRTVTHSDVCPRLPGAGNICANPLLADPVDGDVHERQASPTVDRGSNAEIPPGLKHDYEGQARRLGLRVDMGADELRDRVRPVLSDVSIDPDQFAVAPHAATFSWRLSERAAIRFTIKRRKKGGFARVGGFTVHAKRGAGSRSFSGQLGGEPLPVGRYRAILVATDVQGNRSKPRRVAFQIRPRLVAVSR